MYCRMYTIGSCQGGLEHTIRLVGTDGVCPSMLDTNTPFSLEVPHIYLHVCLLACLLRTVAVQAFKTVAKKSTDKVLAGLPPPGAPDAPPETPDALAAYFSEGRKQKIKALVDSYVNKFVNK